MDKLKRSIKSGQIGMRQLVFKFDGTLATPLALGYDANRIESITKTATGEYLIVLKTQSQFHVNQDALPFCQIYTGNNRNVSVASVDYDRFAISTYKRDDGTAADAYVACLVFGSDNRINN